MTSTLRPAILRIVVPYALFSSIWILVSDRVLELVVPGTEGRTAWSIAKGLAFVGITGVLLAVLLRRELRIRENIAATLRASDERLRLLGDNLPESYVYQCIREDSGEVRWLYVGAGVERVHGVPVERVLREPDLLYSLVHPEDLPVLRTAEAASGLNLRDFRIEVRTRRADGGWGWIHIRARPREEPGGRRVWDGVAVDITSRREMETTMREREAQFRTLFEQASDGILITDRQERIVDANGAACMLLGRKMPDLSGQDLAECIGFRPGLPAGAPWSDLVPGGEQRWERMLRRRGGGEVPAEIGVQRLADGRLQAFLRDITERRRSDAQIARQLGELLRWQEATLGREGRIRELKFEVNELLAQAGRPARYQAAGTSSRCSSGSPDEMLDGGGL